MTIPEVYRTGPNFTAAIDFFDWAQNAGYKKYYLAGSLDDTSSKYIITTDGTLVSPTSNYYVANTADVNFDLTFNNQITTANALATINYTIGTAGASTYEIVWTVYHVRGAVATSLGTVTRTTTGAGNEWWKEAVQFTLTEQSFKKGDILRVNMDATSSVGGTFPRLMVDPSGHFTNTEINTGATIGSACTINIPFKIIQ